MFYLNDILMLDPLNIFTRKFLKNQTNFIFGKKNFGGAYKFFFRDTKIVKEDFKDIQRKNSRYISLLKKLLKIFVSIDILLHQLSKFSFGNIIGNAFRFA